MSSHHLDVARPSVSSEWTSERIRALRGDRTRAELAALVGVTPLTVYRWELPDGAPEARRPRGAIRRRLEALSAGAPPAVRAASDARHEEPSADELARLAPELSRVDDGQLAAAQDALIGLLASGTLRTVASRALATQALARIQLWARAEVQAAFTTLAPLLAEIDRLPPHVAFEVHVTAALVFSALDGRIFDAGKTSAHVARAERVSAPDRSSAGRVLLWYAQVSAAYVMNDPALLEIVLARADALDAEVQSPLLRCFVLEIRAIEAWFGGRTAHAARHFAECARLAKDHGLHLVLARILAQASRQQADDGVDPDEILAGLARVEAVVREGRVAPGWHALFASYAETEAYLRAGRLDAAERAARAHVSLAEELRWAPGSGPLFLARLLLLRGRGAELRALADRALAQPTSIYTAPSRIVAECVGVIADLVDGADPVASVERFAALSRALDEAGAWSYLRRNVAIASACAAVLAGEGAQAERALHRAQQILDVVPSAWGGAALEALRGAHAYQSGLFAEARAHLERATEALELAGDRTHGALARHVLARVLSELGADGAEHARAQVERELERLGLRALPIAARRPRASERPVPYEQASAGATIPLSPLARLTARAPTPVHVQRELLACLVELFPRAAVRLEELDARGGSVEIGAVGELGAEAVTWAQLGDGSGRRYRAGVGKALSAGERELLALAASVAGLAMEVAGLRGVVERTGPTAPDPELPELPGFVCESPPMRRLKADLARLARSRSTVIVTGESGVGKEVVARAIHDLSVRSGRSYVAFNCAAIPRELFEGQLFGYRKGAFTGASADHPGVIRAADGGTLFLDEVGELPLDVQPKLLRFLENGEVFPLGERRPVHVDVRVIAATLRDLEQLVREQRFREDLFYRLQVVPLHVPPLRDRPEDLVALARHFVRALTPEGDPPVLAPAALSALLARRWPGNVRELRNVVERTLAFEPRPRVIAPEHLRFG